MDVVTLGMANANAAKRYHKSANTVVWFGDSITGNGGLTAGGMANISFHPRGFWCHIQNALGHRLRTLADKGVGGETTTQILARVQTDVIALNPGWCHVQGGTNDISAATALTTIQANLTAIWDALDAAGIRVITGTIPPRSTWTGTQKADTEKMNAWIKSQGRSRRNLIVIDYYAVLAAPSAGGGGVYDTGRTFDGIHPSSAGAALMGKIGASVLAPLVPANSWLSDVEGDAANVIVAGNRFATGGSGSTPTAAYYGDHTATGTTFSKAARTDGIDGQWQVFTVPAGNYGSWVQFNMNIGTTLAVGDIVSFAVEYDISSLDQAAVANSQGFYIRLQSYNGSASTDMIYDQYFVRGSSENMSAMDRTGTLKTPAVAVPTGTTIMLGLIHMEGGGTYKLDRVTVTNHTKLGIPA